MSLFTKNSVLFSCLFLLGGLYAKDFGMAGHSFPIQEKSLACEFQKKLEESSSKESFESIKNKIIESGQEPVCVSGIGYATKNRTYQIDPSFTLEEDIKDARDQVIMPKGTVVNPLDKIQLSSALIFIDGTLESHLEWARGLEEETKWVLIKGRPIELEEVEKRPIYFDQQGVYTTKLKIKNVPAKVTQQGRYLLVEEVVLDKGVL